MADLPAFTTTKDALKNYSDAIQNLKTAEFPDENSRLMAAIDIVLEYCFSIRRPASDGNWPCALKYDSKPVVYSFGEKKMSVTLLFDKTYRYLCVEFPDDGPRAYVIDDFSAVSVPRFRLPEPDEDDPDEDDANDEDDFNSETGDDDLSLLQEVQSKLVHVVNRIQPSTMIPRSKEFSSHMVSATFPKPIAGHDRAYDFLISRLPNPEPNAKAKLMGTFVTVLKSILPRSVIFEMNAWPVPSKYDGELIQINYKNAQIKVSLIESTIAYYFTIRIKYPYQGNENFICAKKILKERTPTFCETEKDDDLKKIGSLRFWINSLITNVFAKKWMSRPPSEMSVENDEEDEDDEMPYRY
ncbi:uncharacterized protein LOC135846230 [Planococcus citri]|uniref:uncharacterized protein LOC135846230 n=1 Tax=Planococcus citri TaxID=170843 RepID=UPI0031F9E766